MGLEHRGPELKRQICRVFCVEVKVEKGLPRDRFFDIGVQRTRGGTGSLRINLMQRGPAPGGLDRVEADIKMYEKLLSTNTFSSGVCELSKAYCREEISEEIFNEGLPSDS